MQYTAEMPCKMIKGGIVVVVVAIIAMTAIFVKWPHINQDYIPQKIVVIEI